MQKAPIQVSNHAERKIMKLKTLIQAALPSRMLSKAQAWRMASSTESIAELETKFLRNKK